MWTLLAAGPLRPYDEMFQGYWAKHYTPNWWFFLDRVPNAVAGQAVCLPILATVAIVLAWRHRTWHPLAVVVAAEVGFYVGIGGMKVLIGRTAPSAGEGTFWQGGPFAHGWYGIAYPSGHAAEAVLIYGAAAYLVLNYAQPDTRLRRRLTWLVGLIALNAIVVAFYLGYHWPTDLVAGLLAGGLVLRGIVTLDRRIARRGLPFGWSYRLSLFSRPEPVAAPAPSHRPRPVPVPAAVWLRASPMPDLRPEGQSTRPLTTAWSVPSPGTPHVWAARMPDRDLQLTGRR